MRYIWKYIKISVYLLDSFSVPVFWTTFFLNCIWLIVSLRYTNMLRYTKHTVHTRVCILSVKIYKYKQYDLFVFDIFIYYNMINIVALVSTSGLPNLLIFPLFLLKCASLNGQRISPFLCSLMFFYSFFSQSWTLEMNYCFLIYYRLIIWGGLFTWSIVRLIIRDSMCFKYVEVFNSPPTPHPRH